MSNIFIWKHFYEGKFFLSDKTVLRLERDIAPVILIFSFEIFSKAAPQYFYIFYLQLVTEPAGKENSVWESFRSILLSGCGSAYIRYHNQTSPLQLRDYQLSFMPERQSSRHLLGGHFLPFDESSWHERTSSRSLTWRRPVWISELTVLRSPQTAGRTRDIAGCWIFFQKALFYKIQKYSFKFYMHRPLATFVWFGKDF